MIIPDRVCRAVDDMVRIVTLDLGMRRPGEKPDINVLYWSSGEMTEAGSPGAIGIHFTKTIVICSKLSPIEAAATAAHELRHIFQNKFLDIRGKDAREYDAETYCQLCIKLFYRPEFYQN